MFLVWLHKTVCCLLPQIIYPVRKRGVDVADLWGVFVVSDGFNYLPPMVLIPIICKVVLILAVCYCFCSLNPLSQGVLCSFAADSSPILRALSQVFSRKQTSPVIHSCKIKKGKNVG